MKNVQSFVLGVLAGGMIIACGGGAADNTAKSAGAQTVKIDAGQLDQLVKAVKGSEVHWEYNMIPHQQLTRFGEKGWEAILGPINTKDGPRYLVKRPK